MITWVDFIIFVIVFGVSYGTSSICSIGSSAGVSIPARPPSYIFGIVWSVLYFFIVFSWGYDLRKKELDKRIIWGLYLTLVALLNLWIYLYGCKSNKKYALWSLPFSILTVLFTVLYCKAYLLLPLLVWLLYALMLNFTEVNLST